MLSRENHRSGRGRWQGVPVSGDTDAAAEPPGQPHWLTPGVGGIGIASLLSDLGHEVPTALLPSLLTSTLRALRRRSG